MHRRNQRSQAHITPPPSAKFHGSMSADLDRHRFRNRTLKRIWFLILVVLVVFGTTHYILPHLFSARNGNNDETRPYSNSHLKPKNYLNISSTGQPPPSFDFCLPHGKGDKVGQKYGTGALSQTRTHLGSSARIQRVISKALAGQPVTISVLGGSVSACHGAGDDPISPKCYPSRFFQWWNTVFPHPASELTNGAMRVTTSAYFGYCSTHHIPDVTDLIIVELDASDSPNDAKAMTDHFEILIRSLLIRQDSPAVLLMGHFSPQLWNAHGPFGADHYHNVVAQFYDVPHLSTKPLLFNDFMQDPAAIAKYYADPILASPDGHQLITDVLIGYFQSQICQVWEDILGGDSPGHLGGGQAQGGVGGGGLFGGVGQRKGVPEPHPNHLDGHEEVEVDAEGNRIKLGLPDRISGSEQHAGLLGVPQARMSSRPNDGKTFEEIAPFCVSANDLVNPLPPGVLQGTGWSAFHPGGVGGHVMNTKAHYWYSTLPGSKLRIPIIVGAGDVGVYYLMSGDEEASEVKCQVDDNYGGAKTLSNVIPGVEKDTPSVFPRLAIIDRFVSRGNHFIECVLAGDEEQKGVPAFKIVGFFAT
ncbi:hypothetical protein L218DRAFT_977087 [Marasmius fiardii PR-910]|nr:hypothetical protein L218DRAFT_977087 [Marasmius fiardii PR-910]